MLGRNNSSQKVTDRSDRYKLYKAKKQWVTACATVLMTLGASTAIGMRSVHAATDQQDDNTNADTSQETKSATPLSGQSVVLGSSAQSNDQSTANTSPQTTTNQQSDTASDNQSTTAASGAGQSQQPQADQTAKTAVPQQANATTGKTTAASGQASQNSPASNQNVSQPVQLSAARATVKAPATTSNSDSQADQQAVTDLGQQAQVAKLAEEDKVQANSEQSTGTYTLTQSSNVLTTGSTAPNLVFTLNVSSKAGDTVVLKLDKGSAYQISLPNLDSGWGTMTTADGSTQKTVTIKFTSNASGTIQVKLIPGVSNYGAQATPMSDLGKTTKHVTLSINGNQQQDLTFTQDIEPIWNPTLPTRQGTGTKTDTSNTKQVFPNVDVTYNFSLNEANGIVPDNAYATGKVNATDNYGTTITIPVPNNFKLDESATMAANNFPTGDKTTITQAGAGADIIITVPKGSGSQYYQDDTPYKLVGTYDYDQSTLDKDTTISADAPVTVVQKLNESGTLTKTWTSTNNFSDTFAGKDTKAPISTQVGIAGAWNNNTVVKQSQDIILDYYGVENTSITDIDNHGVQMKLTFSDGQVVNKVKTPTFDGTTSYTYKMILRDGTIKTGTVTAGDSVTIDSGSIAEITFSPDKWVSGAKTANLPGTVANYFNQMTTNHQYDINAFEAYGHVADTYSSGDKAGQEVKSGDTISSNIILSLTSGGKITGSFSTGKVQTVKTPNTLTAQMSVGSQSNSTDGSIYITGDYNNEANPMSSPVFYYVLPANTRYTSFDLTSNQHYNGVVPQPKISTFFVGDREVVKVDYTGYNFDTGINNASGWVKFNWLSNVMNGNYYGEVYVVSPETKLKNSSYSDATDKNTFHGSKLAENFNPAWVENNTDNLYLIGEAPFIQNTASGNTGIGLAQGNMDASVMSSGTSDDGGSTGMSFDAAVRNSSHSVLNNAQLVINLPQKSSASFQFQLNGAIDDSALTDAQKQGVVYKYSNQLANLSNVSNTAGAHFDDSGYVTADQIDSIGGWSAVKSVLVSIPSVAAQSLSGLLKLKGQDADVTYDAGKTGYLSTALFADNLIPTVNEQAASIKVTGQSTIHFEIAYQNGNSVSMFGINLPTDVDFGGTVSGSSVTYNDNQDTMITKDQVKALLNNSSVIKQIQQQLGSTMPFYELENILFINGAKTWPTDAPNTDPTFGTGIKYYNKGDLVEIFLQKAQVTATLSGSNSKNYDGQAVTTAEINSLPSTNTNHIHVTMSVANTLGDGSLSHTVDYTLQDGDYAWEDANGNKLSAAPSAVGKYKLVLTDAGVAHLNAALAADSTYGNGGLSVTSGSLTGSADFEIKQAALTVTQSGTKTETYGSTTGVTADDLLEAGNWQATGLAQGDTLNTSTLTTSDFDVYQGSTKLTATPTDVGTYTYKLNASGLAKLKAANPSYDITAVDGGFTYIINKATAKATLNGEYHTKYTGQEAQIPYDGTYTVKLSNGQTYTLQPGDLKFSTDQPVINAGQYSLDFSEQGKRNIAKVDSAHYNYQFDNGNAKLIIDKINGTATLNGHGSQTYTGSAANIDNNAHYTVTLPNGLSYTLKAGDYTFADADGNLLTSAPTAAGTYHVRLTDQGQQNIEKLTAFNNGNDNNYYWEFDSNADFTISPAAMTVTVDGAASKVYDGTYAAITADDLSSGKVKVLVGNTATTVSLDSSDFTVVNASGASVKNSNYHLQEDGSSTVSPLYYIVLTDSGLAKLKAAYPNYDLSLVATTSKPTASAAYYTIYQRKAAVTVSGTQTVKYGDQTPLNNGDFTVDLTNWPESDIINKPTVTLTDGSLIFVDSQSSTVPTAVGSYDVTISKAFLKALEAKYPNYTFEPATPTMDTTHHPAVYVVEPLQLQLKLNGTQTVRYGESTTIDPAKYTIGVTGALTSEETELGNLLQLQSGDLEFITDPTDVGQYEVQLSKSGLQRLQTAIANSTLAKNYNWDDQLASLRGDFYVTQMPVTITVANKTHGQQITYGDPVTIDNSQYTLTVKDADSNDMAYTLADGDLIFDTALPASVGKYHVVLSPQGLQNIENKFGTKNYTYTSAGHGDYEIVATAATAKLAGSNSKTYDGQAVTTAEVNEGGKITVTLNIPNLNQTISYRLKNGDYSWQDADGKALTTAPADAGVYTITLNKDKVLAGLQQEIAANSYLTGNVALTADDLTGTATYQIKKAAIQVALDPAVNYQTNTFDGDTIAVVPGDFTPTMTSAGVTVPTIPAGTLTADDFDVYNAAGTAKASPRDAGTYQVKLNAKGLAKLAKLSTNFTWPASATGHGVLTINPATALATLSGSNQMVYSGRAVTTADINHGGDIAVKASYDSTVPTSTVPTIALYYANGDQILSYQLRDGDYSWRDSSRNDLSSAPVNVGTYTLILTQQGLSNLQQKVDALVGAGNLAIDSSDPGSAKFTITPFKLSITVNGSAEVKSGTTTIPDGTYSLSYAPTENGTSFPTGWTTPTTGYLDHSQLHFVGDKPTADTVNQSFTVGYQGQSGQSAQQTLQDLLGDNYQVTYTDPGQNYQVTDQGYQYVQYVDVNDSSNVIKSDTLSGKRDSTSSYNVAANVPADWELVDPSQGSAKITIANGISAFKIKHATQRIDPDHPGNPGQPINPNNPDGPKYPDGTDKDSLTKVVPRTINYVYSDGSVAHAAYHDSLTFKETIVIDKVTGKILRDTWSGPQDFATVDSPTIPGYTPDRTSVSDLNIDYQHAGVVETVTYTADAETATITYIDDTTGRTLKVDHASGKFAQPISFDTDPVTQISEYEGKGYKLVSNDYSNLKTYSDDNNQNTFTVHLKHGTVATSQKRTITETIHYVYSDGTKAATDHIQSVTFTRSGVKDLVNGQVSWGTWGPAQTFDAVTSPVIAGYTPDQAEIGSQRVAGDSSNIEKTVTYTKNAPASPSHGNSGQYPGNGPASANQAGGQSQLSGSNLQITETTATNSAANSRKAQQLPQTGNDQSALSTLGFAAMGLTAMLGIGKRKKEK